MLRGMRSPAYPGELGLNSGLNVRDLRVKIDV